MTINDEILILANQIANNGNKPTVALIKNKLTQKVPLPVIISALKVWQHDPEFITLPQERNTNTELNKVSSTTNTFEEKLHQELAIMTTEIRELKQLVQQLIIEQQKG